jgi:hypothetical protein
MTRAELETTAAPGLYAVEDWAEAPPEEVYDPVRDAYYPGTAARILARVRQTDRPPLGAERWLTRPDGCEVVYCWVPKEGVDESDEAPAAGRGE